MEGFCPLAYLSGAQLSTSKKWTVGPNSPRTRERVVLCISPLPFPSSDEKKRTKLTFVQICAMWENKVKLGRKLNLGATVING